MKDMRFKIAYDVVTLSIFLRAPQKGFFVFIMFLTAITNDQNLCAYISN